MLDAKSLESTLPKLPVVAHAVTLHRVVALEHYESGDPKRLLYDEGPKKNAEGQRFTPSPPDGFRGIYAAEDLLTAGSEFTGSPAKWNAGDCANSVIIRIEADLKRVLDLTDATVLKSLKTTKKEILSAWLGYHVIHGSWPATWTLGQSVFLNGSYDGIRFPSKKNPPKGTNLFILTERLSASGGVVRILNSNGSLREEIS